ncbi:MAG TPA: ThuA domain-containing protein [Verrucomicrobiae bacterium]|jgi:trehalose utilization protein|nr:ThuA domain-containing protein [Verrucomicrobiae bacterium]
MNLLRIFLALSVFVPISIAAPIRVLVWDEQQPAQKQVYTNFLGNYIADQLRKNSGFEVRSVNLNEPNQGLSADLLDQTDVLIWWGHIRHDDVPDAAADKLIERVKAGRLALIALHSAHWSAPFRSAMEARLIQESVKLLPVNERANAEPEFIQWRSRVVPSRAENPRLDTRIEKLPGGNWHVLMERPECIFPSCCTPVQPSTIQTLLPEHPIAKGLPKQFTLPETEMYDEPFHVPEPDEVVFREFWTGGEHFRSGMVWKIGQGRVFYFRPGHETYHVYTEPLVMKILENACAYLGQKVQEVAARPSMKDVRMLVFSKTSWYRHPAIPMVDDYLVQLGKDYGFSVDVTEDAARFTPENLGRHNVVLFISTTDIGKSLDDAEKKAFIDWYRAGHALIAMHAASVHHDTWDWYSSLFGTDFDSDSEYVPALVRVDQSAQNNPILAGLEPKFHLDGDWLNFKRSVRDLPGVQVLLTLDEKTYDPVRPYFKKLNGKPMGADHPIAWTREFEGGRFAYTMIGHDTRPLETDFGEDHVVRLIRWAGQQRN